MTVKREISSFILSLALLTDNSSDIHAFTSSYLVSNKHVVKITGNDKRVYKREGLTGLKTLEYHKVSRITTTATYEDEFRTEINAISASAPSHILEKVKNENKKEDIVDTPKVDDVSTYEPLKWMKTISSSSRMLILGDVDESRIAFDELKTGDVPRLYSTLRYESDPSDGRVVSAKHTPGSTVLGAAALVAGTTVGAGILALPAATSPLGFGVSTVGLVGAWAAMAASGLLLAELCVNRIGATGRSDGGILDLYRSSLPPWAFSLGTASYFFLHYAVMVAYVAQGGANLVTWCSPALGPSTMAMSWAAGPLAFTSGLGALLYAGDKISPSAVENLNNAMVAGVLVSFLGVVAIGSTTADWASLTFIATDNSFDINALANAMPILFLSLVYQNVVPTVVSRLEANRSKVRSAILLGTGLPLLLFVAWNAVILGNISPELLSSASEGGGATVDPVALLGHGDTGNVLSILVSLFSELAVVTSMIGFVYGLVDALTDVFGLPGPASGPAYEPYRPVLTAAVYLPPLSAVLLSGGSADLFYDALDNAGAFGVTILFLLLPPLMAWTERYSWNNHIPNNALNSSSTSSATPLSTLPMVPGGKIVLSLLGTSAVALLLQQGTEKFGAFF